MPPGGFSLVCCGFFHNKLGGGQLALRPLVGIVLVRATRAHVTSLV